MLARTLIILVPFLALGCVSSQAHPDVDMRFMSELRDKSGGLVSDKNVEAADPNYARFRRLDYGMNFELVRAILGREPSRDEVKDGLRKCAWSFDRGAYAHIDFDSKNRIVHMFYVPRM